MNSAANPAKRGDLVVLYGTGEGQTVPPGSDGLIATAVYPKPVLDRHCHGWLPIGRHRLCRSSAVRGRGRVSSQSARAREHQSRKSIGGGFIRPV